LVDFEVDSILRSLLGLFSFINLSRYVDLVLAIGIHFNAIQDIRVHKGIINIFHILVRQLFTKFIENAGIFN